METGVGTRTLRGMFWAYGSYVGGRVLVLLSIAILARLLTPADFGLVAFALTVTALLDTVADLGVSQALIVAREDVERKAQSAWTLGVAIGAGLAVVTAALAPVAAEFFRDDDVAPLLAVLGINFLIRGAGTTHYALAQREIEFRSRTAAELADVLVRGTVGIAAALLGAGAWSLVIGYIAGSTAMTSTLWRMVDFRPKLKLVRADARGLLRFGGALAALDVLSAVIANVDYLIVGRVLGESDLGLYSLGYRLPELLIINLSVVAGLVLFPAFATLGRDALSGAFLTSLRYTLMVSVPLTIGLVVLAGPVVHVAFGDQWDGAVEALRVIAIAAFAITVGVPAGTAYKSLGRVDVLLKLAVPRCILAVVLILLLVDRGIVWVAAAQAIVAGTFATIGILLAARLLGTGLRAIAAAAWPAVAAGALLAVALLGVERAVGEEPVLALVVGAVVGGLVYLGGLWLLAPEAIRRLWRTAFPTAPAPAQP
jgi:lipopolysaccharide exporter